jgi:hypothetical protein
MARAAAKGAHGAGAGDARGRPGPEGVGQPGVGSGPAAFDFDREWPFFPDEEKLRVLEPRANVAVLIGHTELEVGGTPAADPPLAVILERLPAAVPRDAVAAIGTVATLRDGVERVVQNLLTNPYVTVLVLCGEDSPVFYPLEGLRCLHRHGVDEGRHVLPAPAGAGERGAGGRAARVFARDALATLSHEDIAAFRDRRLEIVDLRGPLDPAVFFADLAARLPRLVRRVERPSWRALAAIDVYRWRPRVLQVPEGRLARDRHLEIARAGSSVVARRGGDAAAVVATGKPDGRAQRLLHAVLRRGWLGPAADREARLAAAGLDAERAVLAAELPEEAARIGLAVPDASVPDGAEAARPEPLAMDPRGFFKIHVLHERGILAADYHEAAGRHVETLEGRGAESLLAAIVAGDYLGPPPAREQHLVYLAVQLGRADFALRTGLRFEEGQPLSTAARKNVDHHLHAGRVIAGRSLEETWVAGLADLREHGLLTATQKGRVAEGWCTFFLVPAMAEMEIPSAYPASDEHIARYARELVAAAPEVRARGDYTYGDRTCHYWLDQIAEAGRRLAADPDRPCVNQRWAPEADLPAAAHHRPCLVFDVWFRHGGRLHTLQIARSHDVYGGLPQNALGVGRAWGASLAAASGLPAGDLCFLSVSNNFRVGDDAENVRRAIQRGARAAARAATLPAPVVLTAGEAEAGACLRAAAAPVAAVHVPQLAERLAPPAAQVLAADPILAARLLRYRGSFDQVRALAARLRAEAAAGGREHSNSLLLTPRDPVADRERDATPLVCLQVRRQLGRLHAAAVVLGVEGIALAGLLFDLQRALAASAGLPVGSATLARVAPALAMRDP